MLNPDPIARMIGDGNEAEVVIEGMKTMALIDTGAQIATVALPFAESLGIEVKPLGSLLTIEATGGGLVPYEGYAEVSLEVPSLDRSMDTLMLVIPGSPYTDRVPIQLGTLQIDEVLDDLDLDSVRSAGKSWERAYVARTLASKKATIKGKLDEVSGSIKTSKRIILPPFSSVKVRCGTNAKSIGQGVHVTTEPIDGDVGHPWELVAGYTLMDAKSTRVDCQLRNKTSREVVISKKTILGKVAAANIVPPMVASPESLRRENSSSSLPNQMERWGYHAVEETPKLSVPERKERVIKELDLSGIEDCHEETQQEIKTLLQEYHDIFALDPNELGHTSLVKHKITLKDDVPFKERYRRIPPHLYEEVRKHVQEMLDMGAIRPSQSPYASPVVLARKKNGDLRFCIDLRKLNEKTVKDAYSLPRIEDTLDTLNGASVFSSLDLKSGYWQVELEEESKPLTAFTLGPLGFWECERLPFGAVNAPAGFQRLMETCLGELHLNWCLLYLDDIVVYSKDIPSHLVRLRAVFDKLRAAGLKLKPKKCDLFRARLKYLGHIVSSDGIGTDPEKIQCIKDWPVPLTVTDLRSFLGFTNYYRKFLKGYAKLAKPLHKLISGDLAKKKRNKLPWDTVHQEAFDALKDLCATAPVLKYADYTKPFRLHTDASFTGLGAVLYQNHDGVDRVVAYASRSLSGPETRYDAHKLEFLALKWAITDRFHEYLYGGNFEVHTDNNPLTYVLKTAKLDAMGQRWVASLANYNFSLHYRSGRQNIDADALSRIEWSRDKSEPAKLGGEAVKAAMEGCLAKGMTLAELYCAPEAIQIKALTTSAEVGDFTKAKWKREQESDPDFGPIAKREEIRNTRDEKKDLAALGVKQGYLNNVDLFRRRGGLLYRVTKVKKKSEKVWQFVLPKKYHKEAIEACHNDMGHLGRNRTLALLKDRFYWPNMYEDVDRHIKGCLNCLRFKAKQDKAPLKNICATRPMELLHLDFLTIESGSTGKDVDVLVATDHFTRFAQAYVTPSQKASVVAKTLWEKFFVNFGFPEYILSDQGRNFESELIAELCALVQVRKIRTSPYRPMTNGQCERMNATLISMIGTLPIDKKKDWQSQVSTLVHAYNSTVSEATGYSPHFLLYGRESLLPIDIKFKVRDANFCVMPTKKYVKRLGDRLNWAYAKAREVAKAEAKRHKAIYDRHLRGNRLQVGDLVLARELAFKGKHKVQNRWRRSIYKVTKCHGDDTPVYTVVELGGDETHTLHRNYLYPLQVGLEDLTEGGQVGDNSQRGSQEEGPLSKPDTSDEIGGRTEMSEPEPEEPSQSTYSGPMTRSRVRTQEPVQARAAQNPSVKDFDEIGLPKEEMWFWYAVMFFFGIMKSIKEALVTSSGQTSN